MAPLSEDGLSSGEKMGKALATKSGVSFGAPPLVFARYRVAYAGFQLLQCS